MLPKWKIPIAGFNYGLLRFVTDIMEFNYGYYVTFLKDFVDLDQTQKKRGAKPLILGNLENPGRLVTDITEIAITEYYGILWSVISPLI